MSPKSPVPQAVNFVSQVVKRDSFNCRGRPVARLEPVTSSGEREQNGRLSGLVPEDIVGPGRAPCPVRCFTTQPRRPKRDASALAALLAERRDSR